MKTILTNYDIKNIFENIFKNNSENIYLINGTTKTTTDIYEYLNLNLYVWKNRLVEVKGTYSEYGVWAESIDYSLNQIYGLIDTENEEVTMSQDIDNVDKMGTITFLVPTNKIQVFENYVLKLRTLYIGKPEKIQNQDGNKLTTYISIGTIQYTGNPEMTSMGEMIECQVSFTISYINECLTYSDIDFEISFNGDDTYNEDGNIVDELGDPTETIYLTMPVTLATYQNIFTPDSVPAYARANLTGQIIKAITFSLTISFYDYNLALTNQINEFFWGITADRINGIQQSVKSTNIPVYLRITVNGTKYTYKLVVTGMDKSIQNNKPNITSLSLKTYGKGV